jgi:hypothetical protein
LFSSNPSFPFSTDHPIKQCFRIPGSHYRSLTDFEQRKRHELPTVDTKDHQPPRPLLVYALGNLSAFIITNHCLTRLVLFVHGC